MNIYQVGDHVSLIRGRHNIKFGGEVYRISTERAGANLAQGRITFGANVGRGGDFTTSTGAAIPSIYPATVDEKSAVKLFKQDIKFFKPRIGIAYRPTRKWVARLGGGWFDNINHLNNWTILNLMPPKSGSLLFDSPPTPRSASR